ncbi:MAG TPA: S41 family peptidase, partial [Planctomycetota bacterium]|nr:S41 family peptidase [Planctomycetota bacterium]
MDPHRPPAAWHRDLLHLGIGSACGLLVGLAFYRAAPPPGGPEVSRFARVVGFVEEAYVTHVDGEQLVDEALQGMVASLDPYSRYYTRGELAAMQRETSGRYRGIGVVFARPTQEGRVLFALPDSPAARAGIDVGDRILEVDGVRVEGLEPGGLQELLTREGEARVTLRVAPLDGPERECTLERAELVDPSVRHVEMLDPQRGLGYVALHSFSKESPAEFDAAVAELRRNGLKGLVVDVRGNLGGVLRSAVTLANRFVREGRIVTQEGRGEPVVYDAEPSEASYADLPLVVLIDGLSASASEVFAAALQEHRAAVVVGSESYGKGVVQEVRTMEGEGAVKLTTAYYYTPSHRNLERTVEDAWDAGLHPDLEVRLDELETRTLHQRLAGYGPPPEALPRIRAWE